MARPPLPLPARALHAAAIGTAVALFAVGALAWDALPGDLIMHVGADGEPTWSAPKGLLAVFALPLVTLATAVLLRVLAPFGRHNTMRVSRPLGPRGHVWLGAVNLATALLLGILTLLQWFGDMGSPMFWVVFGVYLVVIVAGSAWAARTD